MAQGHDEEFFVAWREVPVEGRDDATLERLNNELTEAEHAYYHGEASEENEEKLKDIQRRRHRYASGT
jgi:hypothetical protein